MSLTIAMAGKGGVGKTTLTGLLVRYLKEKGRGPVLAVDADANANLNEVLGLTTPPTLGEAREEMKSVGAQAPGAMTKDVLIQMRVNQALVEEEGYDLLVMGRPEGPGCYCAANAVLSASLDKLLDNYPYIVIDNEAGLEHLSRVVAKRIDILLIVSDPSRHSLETAVRVRDLVDSLPIFLGHAYVLVNRVPGGELPAESKDVLDKARVELLAVLPDDPEVARLDAAGEPTAVRLPADNPVVKAADEGFGRLGLG
jgi:CO dehydrogenase maturation factor